MALRLGISLALVVVLLALVDRHAVLGLLQEANLGWLLLIIIWLLLDRTLHAWRWILLLRARTHDIPVLVLIRVHYISNFLGNFLPFNLGNDVTRVVSVARYSGNAIDPVSSVLMDRAIGFASLALPAALAAAAAAIWQVSAIGPGTLLTMLGILAVLAFLSVVVWRGRVVQRTVSLTRNMVGSRWINQIAQVYYACLEYRRHRAVILKVFVILQVSLVSGILTTYLAAVALGIDVPIIYFFLFVPVISFFSVLPISANGIGIAEGGFVFLFTQVGVSASEALILALTMRVLLIIATLPGGLLLALPGWPSKAAPTAGPKLS